MSYSVVVNKVFSKTLHQSLPREISMESEDFSSVRLKLGKTQKQMAQLLGKSLKTIHSYEQGLRKIPPQVERQIFLLLFRSANNKGRKPCWVVKKCPTQLKKRCPAWEFNSGDLCWFIGGTICDGKMHKTWREKRKLCLSCEVLSGLDDPSHDSGSE